ncbi:hypothetical protein [Paenibacillus mendelii]|uniref:Tox-GHH domain-containing protein n=1 Tax=Paenibacillus mendelii TaxID=206163 RepID=A0ABV6J4P9_9BACL|nr:hypothetical protein [Paenibacillus mendelii]MCQ6560455.1 hypothetical protein [Paenibacillus mendelii]
MALSEAKKKRLKTIRGGKIDPAQNRLDWQGINPVTRRTPTKQEAARKQFHKYKDKWNPGGKNGDSIFYLHDRLRPRSLIHCAINPSHLQ